MDVTDGHTKQDFVIFAILVCSKFFVLCSSLYFVTIGNKEGSPSNAVIWITSQLLHVSACVHWYMEQVEGLEKTKDS